MKEVRCMETARMKLPVGIENFEEMWTRHR